MSKAIITQVESLQTNNWLNLCLPLSASVVRSVLPAPISPSKLDRRNRPSFTLGAGDARQQQHV